MEIEKPKFEQSKTLENLARSFAGACQSNVRLKMISKKALDAKHYDLSKALYEIAKQDCIHATIFYHTIAGKIKNGKDNIEITAGYPFKNGTLSQNIKNCIASAVSMSQVIYVSYEAVAKDEGYTDIADTFSKMASVKDRQAQVLKQLYEKYFGSGQAPDENGETICCKCGFESKKLKKKNPKCPLCGAGICEELD